MFGAFGLKALFGMLRLKKIAFDIKREKNQNKKFELNQQRNRIVINKIKSRLSSGKKIRVCFFVVFDFSWSYRPIFEEMLKDDLFDPFIVVIPDISRGKENLKFYFSQAYSSLSKKYKNVVKGYSIKTGRFIEYSDKTDIICLPNSYSGMTDKRFEIEHFLDKAVLSFYVNYSFSVTTWFSETLKHPAYNFFWKVFIPTFSHLEEFKKYQAIKGKNATVVGYSKMDRLAKEKIIERKRKKIIIAPHHTVIDWKFLKISNFLQYYDLFLKLPELYPDIDFVFRPHPLLIAQLKKTDVWGEERTTRYFEKITSYKNVVYSEGGDYLNLFANSDGIIHDCGSFLAEYLFTEKPACYLLKDKKSIDTWFIDIGKKCIEHCYQAFSEKDIIDFIENVILKGHDQLKNSRVSFVESELKVNYPNVSKEILTIIKNELKNEI